MAEFENVIRDLRYVKSFGRVTNNLQLTEIADSAITLLKAQPQVVRCKDCRNGETVNEVIACGNSKMYGRFFHPDWFCADGELR